jgi:hypothetical protein
VIITVNGRQFDLEVYNIDELRAIISNEKEV